METKNEVEKAITREIANYQLEIGKHTAQIEYYKGGIKKLSDTLSFFKKGAVIPKATTPKRGGARPNVGRKKTKSKSRKKPSVPAVKWDSIVIPLLEKQGKPLRPQEIIDLLFKGKHDSTKKSLKSRLSVALPYMRKMGKLKSFEKDDLLYYGLPNMSEVK